MRYDEFSGIPNPLTETAIFKTIEESIEKSPNGTFMIKLKKYDNDFVAQWFWDDWITNFDKIERSDPRFKFLLKTVDFKWILFKTKVEQTLDDKNDWPYVLGSLLAESNRDVGLLQNSVYYVLWRQQVIRQFPMASNHLFWYYLESLALYPEMRSRIIDTKQIHKSIRGALEELNLVGLQTNFIEGFCTSFFSNDFQKCLGRIQTLFEPGDDGIFPPYFDPKKSKLIKTDEQNKNSLKSDNIGKAISGFYSDESWDEILPIPELGKHALFDDGVVIADGKSILIFYINRSTQYIGVFKSKDNRLQVGYIRQRRDDIQPYYPNPLVDDNYDGNAVLFFTKFQPFIKQKDKKESALNRIEPFKYNIDRAGTDLSYEDIQQLYTVLGHQFKLAGNRFLNATHLIWNKTGEVALSAFHYSGETVTYLYYSATDTVKKILQATSSIFMYALAGITVILIASNSSLPVFTTNKKRKINK